MSVSRCLGPAVEKLSGVHRSQWKGYIDALPESCPHSGCTAGGCRAFVADYFRVQWHVQASRERSQTRNNSGVARG